MKQRARRVIAWTFLVGGLVGFVLSALRVIGSTEPLLVLLLSWGALVYEGANSVFLTAPDNGKETCHQGCDAAQVLLDLADELERELMPSHSRERYTAGAMEVVAAIRRRAVRAQE